MEVAKHSAKIHMAVSFAHAKMDSSLISMKNHVLILTNVSQVITTATLMPFVLIMRAVILVHVKMVLSVTEKTHVIRHVTLGSFSMEKLVLTLMNVPQV